MLKIKWSKDLLISKVRKFVSAKDLIISKNVKNEIIK
jgi:hypothetical protein